MTVAPMEIAEITERVSQLEKETRAYLEYLERVQRLEENVQNIPNSAAVADKITQIQCAVDEVNHLLEAKKFYLISFKVGRALEAIEEFQKEQHELLPEKIFKDLRHSLNRHEKGLTRIESLINRISPSQKKKDSKSLVNILVALCEATEGYLESFSYHTLCLWLDIAHDIVSENNGSSSRKKTNSSGQPFLPTTKKDKERLRKAFTDQIELIEKAKEYVKHTKSAEAKAIERIENIDSIEWETLAEPEHEINIERMNTWLEKRGYKPQIPCEESPSC